VSVKPGDAQDAHIAFETIVVDDGSSDATPAIATRPGIRLITLDQNQGHGRALNIAIAEARAPIAALLDDDCIPPSTWVQDVFDAWSRVGCDVTMIGGSVIPFTSNTFNRRYVAYREPISPQEADLDDEASLLVRLRFAFAPPIRSGRRVLFCPVGANMSVRTDAFRRSGGFPEWRGFGLGEEQCARALRKEHGKNTVQFDPDMVMYHDFHPSLRDTFRRARAYGGLSGQKWREERGIPSLNPIPIVVTAGAVLLAALSPPLSVLAFVASPLVFYRKWSFEFRAAPSVELFSYPYIHFAEDIATNVGLMRGIFTSPDHSRAPMS